MTYRQQNGTHKQQIGEELYEKYCAMFAYAFIFVYILPCLSYIDFAVKLPY